MLQLTDTLVIIQTEHSSLFIYTRFIYCQATCVDIFIQNIISSPLLHYTPNYMHVYIRVCVCITVMCFNFPFNKMHNAMTWVNLVLCGSEIVQTLYCSLHSVTVRQ